MHFNPTRSHVTTFTAIASVILFTDIVFIYDMQR
jgi:hypothetical protein